MGVDPPDDPGGPGTGPGPPLTFTKTPSVAYNITIEDSSMDTEDGLLPKSERKRSKPRKRCRHCNSKKRKSKDGKVYDQCKCSDDSDDKSVPTEINNENSEKTDLPTSFPPQSTKPLNRKYVESDSGPFTVHVQKITSSPTDPVTLHPIQFGKDLKKINIKNIVNGSLKRIGRNRVSMAFTNYKDANLFTENSVIALSYKVFIPSFTITRVGIVKGVPQEWSEEEIQENITVPIGCGQIIKVRRIKKKNITDGKISFSNTNMVVLTFDGQVLPKRVYMCYTALPVELYIFPTIQCYNCCKFGHTKVLCRSKPRCFKCGDDHTS